MGAGSQYFLEWAEAGKKIKVTLFRGSRWNKGTGSPTLIMFPYLNMWMLNLLWNRFKRIYLFPQIINIIMKGWQCNNINVYIIFFFHPIRHKVNFYPLRYSSFFPYSKVFFTCEKTYFFCCKFNKDGYDFCKLFKVKLF